MPIGKWSAMGDAGTPSAWQAASRPCSLDVAARLGYPMMSPAAKMWGTEVRNYASTAIHPSPPNGKTQRKSLNSADVITVDDRLAIRLDVRRRHRTRSTGDEEVGGGDFAPASGAGDAHPVRVDERCVAAQHFHSVA